jgi:hypothetical protein
MSDVLREKIAEALWNLHNPPASGYKPFAGASAISRAARLRDADAILELPEIKEALATFERINRPNDPNSVHGVDHWAGH